MTKTISIAQCISLNLENYFEELGSNTPKNVWAMVMDSAEKATLEQVMKQANGNQSKAATMLGITRNTLRKKLITHQLLDAS